MQFKSFSYLFLLITLPSALAQSFGTCTAKNGRPGECIKTSTCSGQGGVSDPANLCPGDDTIQVIPLTGLTAVCPYRKHN